MGAMFGGGGGGGSAPAPQPVYTPPPAPGTLVQTVLSGNPNPSGVAPIGETEEQRRQRLALQQFNILGGGLGGAADGSAGSGQGGNAAAGDGSGASTGSAADASADGASGTY